MIAKKTNCLVNTIQVQISNNGFTLIDTMIYGHFHRISILTNSIAVFGKDVLKQQLHKSYLKKCAFT